MFGVELGNILLQCTNGSVEGLRLVAQFRRLSPLRFQLLRQILPQFHFFTVRCFSALAATRAVHTNKELKIICCCYLQVNDLLIRHVFVTSILFLNPHQSIQIKLVYAYGPL